MTVSPKIDVDWHNFFRAISVHVCNIYNKLFIAGKRKYNHGQCMDGQWVFGGIERGTGNAFTLIVTDRTKNTLLPIIQQ